MRDAVSFKIKKNLLGVNFYNSEMKNDTQESVQAFNTFSCVPKEKASESFLQTRVFTTQQTKQWAKITPRAETVRGEKEPKGNPQNTCYSG